ncbi:MAG: c-type cytochrome [Pseudomonadota bacterium]
MFKSLKLTVFVLLATGLSPVLAQKTELLERGKYLMSSVVACGNCHIPRGDKGQPLFDKGLSGGMVFDDLAFKAYASNLTPDAETGIGQLSDAQLIRAIREGVRADGSMIGPPMPVEFYRHLSDDDVAAIVAYLRAQPAVKNVVAKSTYNIPLPASYGPALGKVAASPATDRIKYGEYLANIGHCMECHTPRDNKGVLQHDRIGAGGQVFKGPWGTSVSRNLTPDLTGLKDWTDVQISSAVRNGVDRNGNLYRPPMAFGYYKNISDADMGALIAYLRSLEPQTFAGYP